MLNPMEEPLLADEACEFIGIKRETLKLWVRNRKDLPVHRLHGRLRFYRSELNAYIRKESYPKEA